MFPLPYFMWIVWCLLLGATSAEIGRWLHMPFSASFVMVVVLALINAWAGITFHLFK